MKYFKYGSGSGEGVLFAESREGVYLSKLFGITCGFCGGLPGLDAIMQPFVIDTDKGRFAAASGTFADRYLGENDIRLVWKEEQTGLEFVSSWEMCRKTGILKRKDTVRNIGNSRITIHRCLSRFTFTPGAYEIYSQDSSWCMENRGKWQEFRNGRLELKCEGGRTTQGNTPYVCIRESGGRNAVGFHLLPIGNWVIRMSSVTGPGQSLSYMTMDLGICDDNFRYVIAQGEALQLPEILIQGYPDSDFFSSSADLHEFLNKNILRRNKKIPPVVYNTWFDDFDFLNKTRLHMQLKAAKKAGCEAFVIDAGWYGAGGANWGVQVGDWRERTDAALFGRMKEFSEEVRNEGLGFGLWIEPERIGKEAPILKEHPEWLVRSEESYYYPDLSKKEVYEHFLELITNLIDKYRLVWVKVDFNFELNTDPYGQELYGYYSAFYRLLDELNRRHPEVFFEGCSSGAMRLDLSTLCHFDGHFLSDNVNPKQVLRIYQGALLRLPPGLVTKWVILRSIGKNVPQYGIPLEEVQESLITPVGGTWEQAETTEPDFAARVAMPGIPGFGGDIASLSEETVLRLAEHVAFFKTWRKHFLASKAYLLTPPCSIKDNEGWAAIQLCSSEEDRSFIFVYRLDDSGHRKSFKLRGLEGMTSYRTVNVDGAGEELIKTGEELMREGISVELKKRNTAAIFMTAPERISI